MVLISTIVSNKSKAMHIQIEIKDTHLLTSVLTAGWAHIFLPKATAWSIVVTASEALESVRKAARLATYLKGSDECKFMSSR